MFNSSRGTIVLVWRRLLLNPKLICHLNIFSIPFPYAGFDRQKLSH
jgi:hypothetical protein